MPAADRCRLCYPRGERHGPLSAACAEPDNLRTLTAMTHTSNWRPESAGRMWVSASGPASVVLRWCGRRVGGLGPGLTSESADAARAVLLTI
jgi:hypothetical protein